jgi:hypothetical protein
MAAIAAIIHGLAERGGPLVVHGPQDRLGAGDGGQLIASMKASTQDSV